jgi:hypothetical protein
MTFKQGNVGIGVSNIKAKLHVGGNMIIASANEAADCILYFGTPFNSNGAFKSCIYLDAQQSYSRHNMHFCINNETNNTANAGLANAKLSILANGNVGIGYTNPTSRLHIDGNLTVNTSINSQNCFTSTIHLGAWDIYAYSGANTGNYGSTLNNGDLLFNHIGGTTDAGLMWLQANDSTADSLNFTGSHRSVSENSNLYSSIYIGYIVGSMGNYKDLNSKFPHNKQNIKINSSLPYVELTNKSYCPCVYGVISDNEDYNNSKRTYSVGGFNTSFTQDENDQRLIINAVGEGAVWVSDYNGILENGDYITSSPIPGIGMKQDSIFQANYTVAKITMDCDFNPSNDDEYEMKYIQLDGTIITIDEYDSNVNYKMAFVGCTYHCG